MFLIVKACTKVENKWYTVTSAEKDVGDNLSSTAVSSLIGFVLGKAREQGVEAQQLKLIVEFRNASLVP